MGRRFGAVLLFWTVATAAWGDSGVLIPADKQEPDPSVLALTEMQVEIRIDNGDARVWIRQIFANRTNRVQEGNYNFALPDGVTVSDFAVWDGPVRIPAVILERKRAQAVYQQLKSQAIDPGLLEQGEPGAGEARHSAIFSAHIVPIPAWGSKRLEIEYHQHLPVEARKSYFLLPLKPDAYAGQKAARLSIRLEMHSAGRIKDFAFQNQLLPVHIEHQDEHSVVGTVEAAGIELNENLAATWLTGEPVNAVQVIAFRDPDPAHNWPGVGYDSGVTPPVPAKEPGKSNKKPAPAASSSEAGFFEVTAQLSAPSSPAPAGNSGGRTVVVLMDTSLSMQWEKLERSYAAAARLLQGLTPADRFNLLLFNTQVDRFRPAPVAAEMNTVRAAIDWLRQSHLRGGTDLEKALNAGLEQFAQGSSSNNALALLTDGETTRGEIRSGKLAAGYAARWNQIPAERRPKTDIFAVGDDANIPLLRILSRNGGVLEQVLSTEPVEFRLASFLSKVGVTPIGDLRLTVAPQGAVEKVYALEEAVFDGGEGRWVGQYEKPQKGLNFTVEGSKDGHAISASSKADLPERVLDHDQLPRLWAGARIQALLEQIEREGESEAAINEIIRLARRYKFVTPYTSFLAAPRALLRPRVIRPGDPVLRVHTDHAIVSVVALFSFGLEKPLRYLAGEDVWQTRFLAPPEMKDGSYPVRLILRDNSGRVYREAKSFVIASTPPTVKVHLDRQRYHAGETIPLKASASESTRTLSARIEGLAPVALRWNRAEAVNVGELTLPPGLPAGQYRLTVTAEDIAHNLGTAEVSLEVLP
jgi:Ca-activated chloride channel family protein